MSDRLDQFVLKGRKEKRKKKMIITGRNQTTGNYAYSTKTKAEN